MKLTQETSIVKDYPELNSTDFKEYIKKKSLQSMALQLEKYATFTEDNYLSPDKVIFKTELNLLTNNDIEGIFILLKSLKGINARIDNVLKEIALKL